MWVEADIREKATRCAALATEYRSRAVALYWEFVDTGNVEYANQARAYWAQHKRTGKEAVALLKRLASLSGC